MAAIAYRSLAGNRNAASVIWLAAAANAWLAGGGARQSLLAWPYRQLSCGKNRLLA